MVLRRGHRHFPSQCWKVTEKVGGGDAIDAFIQGLLSLPGALTLHNYCSHETQNMTKEKVPRFDIQARIISI